MFKFRRRFTKKKVNLPKNQDQGEDEISSSGGSSSVNKMHPEDKHSSIKRKERHESGGLKSHSDDELTPLTSTNNEIFKRTSSHDNFLRRNSSDEALPSKPIKTSPERDREFERAVDYNCEKVDVLKLLKNKDYERRIQDEEKPKSSFLMNLMSDEVILSPRTHYISSDIEAAPSPPVSQMQLSMLNRRQEYEDEKLSSTALLKRTLKKLEIEYEVNFGYKPSHADKLKDKEMKKVLLKLAKKKKNDPTPYKNEDTSTSLSQTVHQILENLGQFKSPHEMTSLELNEEKNLLQKELLSLEKKHGRPQKKEEKEIVKVLYERYRVVKRKEAVEKSELVTICENGELELGGGDRKVTTDNSDENEDQEDDDDLLIKDMTLESLLSLQSSLSLERHRLRSLLHQIESEFQLRTGRRMTKEEKKTDPEMSLHYQKYKRVRAKGRLVGVLVGKV